MLSRLTPSHNIQRPSSNKAVDKPVTRRPVVVLDCDSSDTDSGESPALSRRTSAPIVAPTTIVTPIVAPIVTPIVTPIVAPIAAPIVTPIVAITTAEASEIPASLDKTEQELLPFGNDSVDPIAASSNWLNGATILGEWTTPDIWWGNAAEWSDILSYCPPVSDPSWAFASSWEAPAGPAEASSDQDWSDSDNESNGKETKDDKEWEKALDDIIDDLGKGPSQSSFYAKTFDFSEHMNDRNQPRAAYYFFSGERMYGICEDTGTALPASLFVPNFSPEVVQFNENPFFGSSCAFSDETNAEEMRVFSSSSVSDDIPPPLIPVSDSDSDSDTVLLYSEDSDDTVSEQPIDDESDSTVSEQDEQDERDDESDSTVSEQEEQDERDDEQDVTSVSEQDEQDVSSVSEQDEQDVSTVSEQDEQDDEDVSSVSTIDSGVSSTDEQDSGATDDDMPSLEDPSIEDDGGWGRPLRDFSVAVQDFFDKLN